MKLTLFTWRTALIGIVVIKAVLSLAVRPGSFLISYSGISYFLLLLLATAFAVRNGIQNTLKSRTFWFLLATGYGLWALNQYVQLHYELGLRLAVPQNSIADTLLFLHVVPLMAVVTALPWPGRDTPKLSRVVWESFLLLLFWTSLYAYAVFPYQYRYPTSSYGVRFDILYLAANLGLVLAAGVLTLRMEDPWKRVCLHLFGAAVLYSIGSGVANLAIDTGGYVNGKLYGLCLSASVCWFLWIPLQARQEARVEASTIISGDDRTARPSLWPIVAVVIVSIPIVWELLRRNENAGLRILRLSIAVALIVCLASAAYVKEYLARRESLRESEQRFHLAAQAGNMFSFDWDVRRDVVVRSPEHVRVLGLKKPLGSSRQEFIERIHPDDRQNVVDMLSGLRPNNPIGHVTCRVQLDGGALRWLKSSGRTFFDGQGRMVRAIGMVADITELKQTEEALSSMTRKLIESQEQERARIGRELHDDISQRLALLAIELEQLGAEPSAFLGNRAQELRKQVDEICGDVEALSHELHTSKLQYLGVVAGMRSWCREYGERQKIEIDFTNDVNSPLPFEIGLSLFRVLQEALHNAAKYSGVKRVEAQLRQEQNSIHLLVKDSGKGFDVESALLGKGLGLTSMRERARLVNGTIAIESKPMSGTRIYVRVPFEAHNQQMAG